MGMLNKELRWAMNKAIFLDRDGTINVDKHYVYKAEDFEFLPYAIEGLKLLQEEGFLLLVLTNQSGIARGYYTEKELRKLNDWMVPKLQREGVSITQIFYCPHLPDAKIKNYRKNCDCRKPALGMFERAVLEFNIDLAQSYTIGDKLRDHAICDRSGCRGYLVGKGEKQDIIDSVERRSGGRIKYMDDLYHCALDILDKRYNGLSMRK